MAVREIPWARDPHTAAKHRVLERYLQAWWPIMLSRFPRVTYVEGFAGPGVYKGGEPGSPIIALRTLQAAAAPDTPVDVVFIDHEPRCLSMLQREIGEKVGLPVRRSVQPPHLILGKAAEELLPRLDALGAWRGGVFAFLDSWGNVAVPLDVVRHFARPGCEVFVTLGRRFWSQFGTSLDPQWDEMFGSDEWRQVADVKGAAAQARFITDCYRRSLRSAGFEYLLDFELVNERGDYLYLIHATTNERGLEKMKEAIWAVDPVSGTGFRDPRGVDAGQQMLGLEWQPDVAPLHPMIAEWARAGPVSVEEIRRRVFLETVYKPAHATAAVRTMLAEGLLRRSPAGGQITRGTMIEHT